MTVIVLLAVLVGVGLLYRRRRARAATLAGLNSAKPTFMLAPPTRTLTARKDNLL